MKLSSLITLEGGFYFPDLGIGDTFEARAAYLRELGCDMIEIWGQGLDGAVPRVKKVLKETGLEISAVCSGFRGSLLHADREKREMAMSDMNRLLTLGAELGAVGMIMVPIFKHMPQIADLLPYKSAQQLQMEVLCDALACLNAHAESVNCKVLIEPVNRYETHLINRVEQAVDVCRIVGGKGLGVIADTYHMNIEEKDIGATIRRFGDFIEHVHLVDSNRFLPGQGHTDFAPIFAALKAINYKNSYSFECFVDGEQATAMKDCVDFINNLRN
ncbi:MAG: sugar phosphate isomerase/epimerase [Phycisphaeraceae bacterium]|nr:sugar phosphate isomerase/epimerase [Phycisphaeraceae bacterium]